VTDNPGNQITFCCTGYRCLAAVILAQTDSIAAVLS
jgi:hypothetical protein